MLDTRKIPSVVQEALFLLTCLFSLVIINYHGFFPTLDGPAHLYNAHLIKEILLHDNAGIQQYYALGSAWQSNWTGHLLLAVLGGITSAATAEKLLISIFALSLAYSFRFLLWSIPGARTALSFFVFPVIFSMPLFMGFFNYCLSLPLLFVYIALMIKVLQEPSRMQKPAWLAPVMITLMLMYYTHPFVLLFALFLSLLYFGWILLRSVSGRLNASSSFHFLAFTGGVFMLPVGIFLWQQMRQSHVADYQFLPRAELASDLFQLRFMIALIPETEAPYVLWVRLALAVLVLAGLWLMLRRAGRQVNHKVKGLPQAGASFWLVTLLATLILYFSLPDSDGAAGYVSVRLAMMIYFVALIWLAHLSIPRWMLVLCTLVVLWAHFQLGRFYKSESHNLNQFAQNCHDMSHFIAPNSVVLPVTNNFWTLDHFSNYLGIEKPLIILENYEAKLGYFPVHWNYQNMPHLQLPATDAEDCRFWPANTDNEPQSIEYLFFLGPDWSDPNPCEGKLLKAREQHYELIYQNDHSRLFALADR